MSDVINPREGVLLATLLHGERYGREIREEYTRRAKHDLPLGSLYVTLDRMEAKGYIKSRMGESVSERGGNRRKYYKITGNGVRALNQLQSAILPATGGLANA